MVATVSKSLEIFKVKSDYKKKNCLRKGLLIDNPVNVYSVKSITNLDCVNPMIGKNQKLQHIQRSFFANVPNYVTDTLQICNSNDSRSESCMSSCFPLNLSKFNLKKLSSRTNLTFFKYLQYYRFFSKLKQEDKSKFIEFQASVQLLKLSLRVENQGTSVIFENDIMSEMHQKLLTKYKGEQKLPSSPLVFADLGSNKLIRMMIYKDKILKDVMEVVEDGRPLDRFRVYLITFQRDIHEKEVKLFDDNKLIVPEALRFPFMKLLHETHSGQFGMKGLAENVR